jgi:hypothetical protein
MDPIPENAAVDVIPPDAAPAADAGLTPAAVLDDVSSFLLWLSKRWPALGLAGLVMATMVWIDFIRLFDLPVSFVSPGVLSALPVVGLSVGVPVIAAMVGSAVTAFALWLPLVDGGPSLARWHTHGRNAEPVPRAGQGVLPVHPHEVAPELPKAQSQLPDLYIRWVVLCTLQAAYWISWIVLVANDVVIPMSLVLPIGYAGHVLAALLLFRPVFRAALPTRRPSIFYLGGFVVCSIVQTTTGFLLLLPVLGASENNQPLLLVYHGEAYFIAFTGLGLIQLLAARLIVRGWYLGLLKHLFLVAMPVMALVVFFPDVGGELVSYRLRIRAPDQAKCAVFSLRTDPAAVPLSPMVVNAKAPRWSVPLKFVTRLDDTYYVKEQPLSGPTMMVPVSMVTAIRGCPDRE